jgi:ligand-binding sensor domain-containing protein
MKLYFLLIYFLASMCYSQNYSLESFLKGTEVYDISGDSKEIWVATNGNGVFSYNLKNNRWSNFSTNNNKLKIDFFYAIDVSDKFVWAGSTDGLFILDKRRGRWSKRKFGKGGQLSNWIRSVKYDKKNNVTWIGRFKYLSKHDVKRRRFTDYDLTANNDEKTNTIKAIQIDGDSLVWFGTENGLHKYDKSSDINNEKATTFYDNSRNFFQGDGDEVSIASILLEQGNVWIGLDEFRTKENPDYNLGGLYKFDRKNNWIKFDTRKGLAGNGVFDIELTGNFLWVAQYQFIANTKEIYGRGLAIINRHTNEVTQVDIDGLPDKILSLYFDSENLWIGTDDGIFKLELTNSFIQSFTNSRN